MNVPVFIGKKEYRITGDINQYIVSEVRIKDGKELLVPVWFF